MEPTPRPLTKQDKKPPTSSSLSRTRISPRAHHSPTVTPQPGTEIETHLRSQSRCGLIAQVPQSRPRRKTSPAQLPFPFPDFDLCFPKRYLPMRMCAWTRSVPCICTLATAHRLHLHRQHQLSWRGGAVEGRAARMLSSRAESGGERMGSQGGGRDVRRS